MFSLETDQKQLLFCRTQRLSSLRAFEIEPQTATAFQLITSVCSVCLSKMEASWYELRPARQSVA